MPSRPHKYRPGLKDAWRHEGPTTAGKPKKTKSKRRKSKRRKPYKPKPKFVSMAQRLEDNHAAMEGHLDKVYPWLVKRYGSRSRVELLKLVAADVGLPVPDPITADRVRWLLFSWGRRLKDE